MKVGVINFFKAPNYGAFLLAFAMKKKIEELGGNCYFIDIQKENKNKVSKISLFCHYFAIMKVIVKMVFSGKFINLIKSIKYKNNKEQSFNKFQKLLECDKIKDNNFDLVIVGSDEVFNIIGYTNFDLIKWLNKNKNCFKKLISYAASCGSATFEKIKEYNFENKMYQFLLNFNTISVRDQNTFDIVKKLTTLKSYIHVDPVLFFDFKDYLNPNFKEKNYILLYSFQYKITKYEKNEIIKFAKQNNKKIISIGCYYDWCDKAILPKKPFEVLDYFKNADYVISDTFHGIVFSIKYNKNFCALIRSNNNNKLNYLLKQFNLEYRKAEIGQDIPIILGKESDYLEINQFINKETKKSVDYLSNFIKLN